MRLLKKRAFSASLAILAVLTMVTVLFGALSVGAQAPYANSGFAAVGAVDTENKTATVLFTDGATATVGYTGTAPAAGAVHAYTRSGAKFTFTLPTLNWGESDQLGNKTDASYGDGRGWAIYPYNWGFVEAFHQGDGQINYYYDWAGPVPVFIRYSATSWRVLNITSESMAHMAGGGLGTTGYFASYQHENGNYYCNLMVIGDNDGATIVPATADTTKAFDPEGNGWAAGDKDLSGAVPAVTAVGYAAVGKVDTEGTKAQVLLDNGSDGTVAYKGTAPTTGAIHYYEQYGDGTYAFTLLKANHGNSDQLAASSAWGMGVAIWGGFWDTAMNIYRPVATMPLFIRYSATDWRVQAYTCTVEADYAGPVNGYAFVNGAAPEGGFVLEALMVGNCDANGVTAPAETDLVPFGGDTVAAGDVDLSVITDVAPDGTNINPAPGEEGRGYAAVGKVDTAEKKARILLEDGTAVTVTYTGEAPKTGAVYAYAKYSDGTYAFEEPIVNWADATQLSSSAFTHGKETGKDRPGISAWPLQLYERGAVSDYDWSGTVFNMSDTTPIFIRYSETEWRVGNLKSFKFKEGGITKGYFTFGMNEDGSYYTDLLVIGDYQDGSGVISPSPEMTAVLDPDGKGWTVGDKDLSAFTDVEPPEEVTKVEEGVCAVGEVGDGRAVILKANGKAANVSVRGGLPLSGELSTYVRWSDGKYSFALATMAPGTPTTAYGAWDFAAYNNAEQPHQIYAGDDVYRATDKDSAFFVRYSATDWRVFRGADAVKGNGITFRGYISERQGDDQNVINYMLIGDYDTENKKIIPANAAWSSFLDESGLGWDKGNVTLKFGSINPETGEESHTAVVVAVMISAALVCMAMPVLWKKRNDTSEKGI